MEIAGYNAAQTTIHILKAFYPGQKNIAVICGPGNNGGDGLLAAKYLKFAGYEPIVICPKTHFTELVEALRLCEIPFATSLSEAGVLP